MKKIHALSQHNNSISQSNESRGRKEDSEKNEKHTALQWVLSPISLVCFLAFSSSMLPCELRNKAKHHTSSNFLLLFLLDANSLSSKLMHVSFIQFSLHAQSFKLKSNLNDSVGADFLFTHITSLIIFSTLYRDSHFLHNTYVLCYCMCCYTKK